MRKRVGVVFDVAAPVIASAFCSLKTERMGGTLYSTREAARTDVFEYSETFHKTKRRAARAGYKTPGEYETKANWQGKHAA